MAEVQAWLCSSPSVPAMRGGERRSFCTIPTGVIRIFISGMDFCVIVPFIENIWDGIGLFASSGYHFLSL